MAKVFYLKLLDWVRVGGPLVDTLFILVVPNILFLIVSLYFSLNRPLINFDYIVVVLVLLLGYKLIGLALLLFAFFSEILYLIGQVLPVPRVVDVLYLLKFLNAAPAEYKALFAFICIFLIAKAILFLKYSERGVKVSSIILINGVVFLYVLPPLSGKNLNERMWRVDDFKGVSSPTIDSVNFRKSGFISSFTNEPEPLSESAHERVVETWLDSHEELPQKMLLVLVESWGVIDPEVQAQILAPLRGLPGIREYSEGTVSFTGLTISAELKELCGLSTSHFNLRGVSSGYEVCLPNILKNQGYRTTGIHGATGLMYDRAFWYPRAGFVETLFFENFDLDRRCYSFPGACDIDLMQDIPTIFEAEGAQFVYWLTLNSHAFYDERDIFLEAFDCERFNIPISSQTCRNLRLHAQFFFGLAEVLEAPAFEGVSVLLVSDHAPPIIDQKEKEEFYLHGEIPWVSFKLESE